jgi:phage terminase large subunit-like protein
MRASDLRTVCGGLDKSAILAALADLSDAECEALLYDWQGLWARESQLPPPGAWFVWLLLAGRGFGKSRTGAEYIRDRVEHHGARRIALVGPTAADVRDVMVEGESGLLAVCPPWNRPVYEPSKRRLTWPNGAIATCYSADMPDRLRGPQHDLAWSDELAAWRYADEAWDMLMFGMRLGADPRVVVTTTPRPTKIIKGLVADATTATTRGSTYDNAGNLAPTFLAKVRKKYEGTRLGRQELNAEILDDNPNALWQRGRIDELRVTKHTDLVVVVTGVDPAASANEDSAETGIIGFGIGWCSCKGAPELHGFVLEDASTRGTPADWGGAAVTTHHKVRGDRIVGEVNNGGDMVGFVIQSVEGGAAVPFVKVHASRGKATRAEPISALYEQGRIHHVGSFPILEDQMCEWQPGMASPDRIDALVWAATEAFFGTDDVNETVEHYEPYVISPI